MGEGGGCQQARKKGFSVHDVAVVYFYLLFGSWERFIFFCGICTGWEECLGSEYVFTFAQSGQSSLPGLDREKK